MVDLQGQYEHIKVAIDAAILDVVRSAKFINGPEVSAFKKELEAYLGIRNVIPCANGTDALQIAMMALGLQPGDEVITADFTYIATAEVIALLKLTPVLVDVDPFTFNIDPAAIEKAITPKTRAIVPVHLFGQCADMGAIMEIAKKHKLFVIEDNAQAIGSFCISGNKEKGEISVAAGTIGTIGCTSFFPSKNLGGYGDGGAIFTNDDVLAEKVRMIANHGQSKQYYHDAIGVNSRLDSIQAAVLRIKLRELDNYVRNRQAAAAFYDEQFKGHPNMDIPARATFSTHSFHQYTLKLKNTDRDAFRNYLAEKGVPSNIYYPLPLHFQKAFKNDKYKEGTFPISEDLCKAVISLPMHTELDEEQLKYITKTVLDFWKTKN